MSLYTQIQGTEGKILVEVDREAQFIDSNGNQIQLTSTSAEKRVSQTFREALDLLIVDAQETVSRLRAGLKDMPNEIEIEFGIKVGGEVSGNVFFALAKASVDANYVVKIKWNAESEKK